MVTSTRGLGMYGYLSLKGSYGKNLKFQSDLDLDRSGLSLGTVEKRISDFLRRYGLHHHYLSSLLFVIQWWVN